MAPVGTSGTWFAFWKDHQTLPADVREGTVDPEGLGREAETLAELGAGVPLSWAGTWCRWREARVNGDQAGPSPRAWRPDFPGAAREAP